MADTIVTGQARKEFGDLINRVAYGKERVTITRHGKGMVAFIPIDDIEEHTDTAANSYLQDLHQR